MRVRRSAYRRPVTPGCLREIESERLEYFDTGIYTNLNTGVLEQYLDEKNRKESFQRSEFSWKKVILLVIIVGLPFTIVTEYVALKVGIGIAASFYISYLIALTFKWDPIQINIASGAATAAEKTVIGLVYTFPAIYFLSRTDLYLGSDGERIISTQIVQGSNIIPLLIGSALFSALLGLMYFIIFRRLWVVEDPLPTPGFQAYLKLLDIANNVKRGAIESDRKPLLYMLSSIAAISFFSLSRDLSLIRMNGFKTSVLDWIATKLGLEKWYSGGVLHLPYEHSTFTNLSLGLFGLYFAIGWFLRLKGALAIFAGTLFTWFVIIPMAYIVNFPIYSPKLDLISEGAYVPMRELPLPEILPGYPSPAMGAFYTAAQLIGIGVILGSGVTALIKVLPIFKTAIRDVTRSGVAGGKEWIPGKGFYEWPIQHIVIVMAVSFLAISMLFTLVGSFPPLQSFVFSAIMIFLTVFLGALTVKITGETGIVPISAMSILTFIMIYSVLKVLGLLIGFPGGDAQLILMSLIGATVFGTTVNISSDIIWDFKNGLYIGTRPMHLITGESIGIILGIPVSVLGAYFLSTRILLDNPQDFAPQAHLIATFIQVITGGNVMSSLLVLGFVIGSFVELLTGMGVAFGIGMYIPMYATAMVFFGGVSRSLWEKYWLKPKAKVKEWSEDQITLKTLNTYMVMIGLFIGEAVSGITMAVYLITTG